MVQLYNFIPISSYVHAPWGSFINHSGSPSYIFELLPFLWKIRGMMNVESFTMTQQQSPSPTSYTKFFIWTFNINYQTCHQRSKTLIALSRPCESQIFSWRRQIFNGTGTGVWSTTDSDWPLGHSGDVRSF